MSEIKISLVVEVDGNQTYSIIRRQQVNELQVLNVTKAGGDQLSSYVVVPSTNVSPALNAIIISTDQPVNLKTGGVSAGDGIIPLLANGLLLIIGGNVNSGAASNITVNNTGANPANLSGLVAGT